VPGRAGGSDAFGDSLSEGARGKGRGLVAPADGAGEPIRESDAIGGVEAGQASEATGRGPAE
jgi:hypothetical protein